MAKTKQKTQKIKMLMHQANELQSLLSSLAPTQLHGMDKSNLPEGIGTISLISVKKAVEEKIAEANKPYEEIVDKANKIIEDSKESVVKARSKYEKEEGEDMTEEESKALTKELDDLWEQTQEKIREFGVPDFERDNRGATVMFVEVPGEITVELSEKEYVVTRAIVEAMAPFFLLREKDILALAGVFGIE